MVWDITIVSKSLTSILSISSDVARGNGELGKEGVKDPLNSVLSHERIPSMEDYCGFPTVGDGATESVINRMT